MTTQRPLIALLGMVAIALTLGQPIAAQSAETRPNILWLIGEDMGPELSCYGTQQVWTPNLDELADRGMRFTKAFTTAPVCSASRSAFMTGMYQTTIGAHNHRSHRNDDFRLPEGVRLLSHRLHDAGYFTANIRKINAQVKGTGKTDWNFNFDGKAYDSNNWSDLKSHQPFYAQVNFSEAHRGGSWPEARKQNKQLADPDKVRIPPYYPDHPLTRDDWANYLDSITGLDRKIGLVLQQLKDDGLADNTIVIFFGDHGRAMIRGKQWCYDSGLHVPLIVFVPPGLQVPAGYQPSTVSDQLVEAIDISATTLDLAGVEKPANMQGRILFGPRAEPARDYVFAARDRCDETVFRIRTVRDARYRYIRNFMPERPFLQTNQYKERQYPVVALMRQLHAEGKLDAIQEVLMTAHRPAEELYDTQADPYEIHNLADSPEHRHIKRRLKEQLDSWIETSNDQGRTPEPREVIEYWERRQQAPARKRPKRKSTN